MNLVETILLENGDKPASLFVFPTDIAVSRWVDRLLQLRTIAAGNAVASGSTSTVAMEKFIAWDTFKRNSVRSKVQDRRSIPSVLRKMFVSALIRENAQLCAQGKTPVFTSLIREEWAQQADSYTGWLTEILPQLALWCRQTLGCVPPVLPDFHSLSGDDSDLYSLTLRYTQFLDKHGLFEPAWETPPFEDTGKECFIFFPESLSDFGEYQDLLAASSHVKIIHAAAAEQHSNVFFYSNSRSEITEAALYILALHNNRNVPWDSISVSIPEDECYGPYLFREFANRNIPYIRQTGKPLASYPAGQFFAAVADCISGNFSFSAVTALLLNRHLPWKDDGANQDLIDFGINNNCISSWTENNNGKETAVNVWEDAFAYPFGKFKIQTRHYFEDLKRRINAMRYADSFSSLRKHYFAFRERFFNMENALDETDLVLSRCISELMNLIDIEKSFPDVQVPDHYTFFTGYLTEVNYLAQQSSSGVAILPYRTAAPAPFDCHIILGANQNNLSNIFATLAFLPRSKREKLGLVENDASLAFIQLHQFNSRLPAAFFCSEHTFTGYTIPHSALNSPVKPQQRYGDDPRFSAEFAADLYRMENPRLHSLYYTLTDGSGVEAATAAFPKMHANQKRGFDAWKRRRNHSATNNNIMSPDHPLLELIKRQFRDEETLKYGVSASSLKPYYQCPSKWIFERVLKLENVEIETGIMTDYITGRVYHAVLHLFLEEIKKTGNPVAAPLVGGSGKNSRYVLSGDYRKTLAENVATVFKSFPCLPESAGTEMSMLTARILREEQSSFFTQLELFLAEFTGYFAGYKVITSEARYISPEITHCLKGDIDCILENEGNLIIVDFKTKTMPELDGCIGEEGLEDFQLPMYIRLAQDTLKKEAHTALFFSIVDAVPRVVFGVIHDTLHNTAVPNKEDDRIMRGSERFLDIMGEFEEKAERFAQEINSGAFSFFPSHSPQCPECTYNRVCRTLYKICQGRRNGT